VDAVSPPTASVGLLDAPHYEERPGRTGAHPGDHVVGVHVYHDAAFIEKGVNAEQYRDTPRLIPTLSLIA